MNKENLPLTREIKFRVYVESILPEETGVYEPEFISGFSPTLGIDKVITKEYNFKSDTCKFTLLQYTGLKDKNGTEIYEGDTLQTFNYSGMKLSTFEVEYMPLDNCGDCTNDSGIGFNFYLNNPNECEVIGNIYENKDLL